MKIQTIYMLLTTTLGTASPTAVLETEQGVEPVRLESRATPYDLLSSYAHDLILKPIIGRGIDSFLGQSTQVVDLSQKALTEISNIVKEAIEEAWYARDKLKVAVLIQNSRDYTRLNKTESQIARALAVATDHHEEANLLLNYLSLYGLKAAPVVQTMIGVYTAFKKEEIALTKDLDALTNSTNHLIKFRGFLTRYEEIILQLKAYGQQFNQLPGQLFRTRQTETGGWPCPGCICKKSSHTAYFESRPNLSSPWKVEHKLQQTWPYCGKRPTDKINAHVAAIHQKAAEAKKNYVETKRDAFLTSGYDELVRGMEEIKMWDVDRLISSLFVQDPSLPVEV